MTCYKKISRSKAVMPVSRFGRKFHYRTIKTLYNSCTGIYKFGNNTYPQRIRRRSNLGHIFRGKKSASYGPGNTVTVEDTIIVYYSPTNAQVTVLKAILTFRHRASCI
jgi:hypothetical protein